MGAYFRHKLPETPRFTAQVRGDYAQAARDINSVVDDNEPTMERAKSEDKVAGYQEAISAEDTVTWAAFKAHYSQWKHFKVLLGCSLSWFFLDVAFYGLGLNQSIVLTTIGYSAPKHEVYNYLYSLAAGNCIINMLGSVPGYYVTVALVEKMGRVRIQLMGFSILTVLFVIMSAAYVQLTTEQLTLFIVLYCFAQFFFNFGPNTTTFIIPGEVFPTKFRTTSHGICAATGKAGAILSSYGFTYLTAAWGVQGLLGFFAVVMFLGIFSTFLIPETQGITLEDLSRGQYKRIFGNKSSVL